MKKSIFLVLAALGATLFSSCMDSDSGPIQQRSFVTVHQRSIADDYYFETDTRKTIYPSDKSRIAGYEAKEGQRALIAFGLLDETIAHYDYNALMYGIVDIYTGQAGSISSKEELDEIPDDPIKVTGTLLCGDWMTLEVAYAATNSKKHQFHLFINDADPKNTERDYLDMELRHDKAGDSNNIYYGDYISFNLQAIRSRLQDKKGVMLRYKDDNNQVETIRIERIAE